MSHLTPYQFQVLVQIGTQCRPNSPYPRRSYTVVPTWIRSLGLAIPALLRAGMIEPYSAKQWFEVRPTKKGYAEIKLHRSERRVASPLKPGRGTTGKPPATDLVLGTPQAAGAGCGQKSLIDFPFHATVYALTGKRVPKRSAFFDPRS